MMGKLTLLLALLAVALTHAPPRRQTRNILHPYQPIEIVTELIQ